LDETWSHYILIISLLNDRQKLTTPNRLQRVLLRLQKYNLVCTKIFALFITKTVPRAFLPLVKSHEPYVYQIFSIEEGKVCHKIENKFTYSLNVIKIRLQQIRTQRTI